MDWNIQLTRQQNQREVTTQHEVQIKRTQWKTQECEPNESFQKKSTNNTRYGHCECEASLCHDPPHKQLSIDI